MTDGPFASREYRYALAETADAHIVMKYHLGGIELFNGHGATTSLSSVTF